MEAHWEAPMNLRLIPLLRAVADRGNRLRELRRYERVIIQMRRKEGA
jgi:hypothetical protein